MSDHLAIAAVSAAVGQLIQGALDVDVPGALVSHDRPGAPGEESRRGTNIFLYQVLPSASLRNNDLPTRTPAGNIVQRPTAALDLAYLFTFYGDALLFEPERMAGSLARLLHQHPILHRDLIEAAVAANPEAIGDADLADAPELVKFTPTPLNLEELSKLWSILFQTSYKLSVAYRASVVQIESRSRSRPALPVQRRDLFPFTLDGLDIAGVEAAAGPGLPILWESEIRLSGRGFDRPDARLRIGDAAVVPDPARTTANETVLTLDAATLGTTLAAGVQVARLTRPIGNGAPAHLAQSSRAAPFLLQPSLSFAADAVDAQPIDDGVHDGTLTVGFSPPIQEDQHVTLQLDRTDGATPRSTVLVPTIPAAAVFPLAVLVFAFTDLAPGSYLVRARVDGAESPLATDQTPGSPSFGEIIGPRVAVP